MNKIDLRWRVIITILIVGAAVYMMYPPLDTLDPETGDVITEGKLNLGLDLQGGIHMVMDVKTEEAVAGELVNLKKEFERMLRKEKKRDFKISVSDDSFSLLFMCPDFESREWLEETLKEYSTLSLRQIEVSGEYQLLASMTQERIDTIKENALDQALLTIRNRIDELGVSEPVVQQQKSLTKGAMPRILVQLPGIKDISRAKKIIGKTALLEFRMVKDGPAPKAELLDAYNGQLPTDTKLFDAKARQGGKRMYYLLKKDADVTGADLDNVLIDRDEYGQWAVSFTLSRAGGRKFARVTEENMDQRLAIVLDGKVQSAPVIRARISRNGQITGNYSLEEAEELMIVLRSGALPASVVPFEERTVGPSLGHDSIERGIKSMVLGVILVIIFMIIWYKFSGCIADFGMLCTLAILFGVLASLKATLTLPGIAGIILTVGMAVDANVLIFERIREELRSGKTVRTAVAVGYERAFITIMDANVTTLIAAVVLLQFGIGPIRGFAVTLSIGIVASMFAALFISRVVMDMILQKRDLKKLSI